MSKKKKRVPLPIYEAALNEFQAQLVDMQRWVKDAGARVVIIFEGRDAAGKGSAIKRVTEYLSPRVARIAALPTPTPRETTQWYFQRYAAHLPAAGEMVLFDRSWYNRAGVERVMGFCTDEQYERFLLQAPIFEKLLIDDGIILIKLWFSVSDREQEKRFRSRATDPLRQWKLSPMDLESITRWDDYSRAKDRMFEASDVEWSRWVNIESDDKRASRLNAIKYILDTVPWKPTPQETVTIPKRPKSSSYVRPSRGNVFYAPDFAATLIPPAEEES